LRSRVTIVGVGSLADAVVPYLAGAGIGGILFRPTTGEDASAAASLAERVVQINPDVRTDVGTPMTAQAAASRRGNVTCETTGRSEIVLSLVRETRIAGAPLVAAGLSTTCGWMSVVGTHETEAGCVFCGWLDARTGVGEEAPTPRTPTVLGAVAALLASCVIDTQLGCARARQAKWLRYGAETMTLEEHVITPREDCPVCGVGAGGNTCHPTLDF
jgi:molybdopterin/thiamine biosynthesis adenylyltransferase